MVTSVVVLGCGRVGGAIARDLASDERFRVTVADASRANLDNLGQYANIVTRQADLGTFDSIGRAVEPFDLVVGALPSALGLAALRAVIEAGKPFADISFMPEDAMEWDARAKDRGVTAVVDCGVAPGLANMIIGHCHAELDRTERVEFYVGGLPRDQRWPYQYKAPFAPSDVIEIYTRPARMVENGQVVIKPALSEPELIDFPKVGTLEAFNSDGLRSLIRTVNAPFMKEKTLRYPGHAELMRVLRETGFFGKDPIEVNGVKVRPLDLTSQLLFPIWNFDPGEREFTVLRVIVEGEKSGEDVRIRYDMVDEYDPATEMTSMARTTAFPCAIVARMLADGTLRRPGVWPPESLGAQPGVLDRVLTELADRNVIVQRRLEPIE